MTGALNYIVLTTNGSVASGDTNITFNEAVPTTGYPFMLVVSSPFEVWEATAFVSTYVLTVSRRQESTTNTSTIADGTTVVCELTHETLENVYDSILLSEKLIGDNDTGHTGTPDDNEIIVDTTDSKVYIGVSGSWEELAPESHADLDDLATSTGHTQYFTNGRANTWHAALSGKHLGTGVLEVSINTAGTGYSEDDILTISGGGDYDCTLTVTSVGTAGDVTGVEITTVGSGYSLGSDVATSGGSGSSCTIDIDTVSTLSHDHFHYPAANIRNLAAEPADTTTGGVYYNTTNSTLYYYDGADWKQYNTVPPNDIIFREDGSCPDGWTEKTSWDGYFLKGDDSGTWVGGSGGSSTHKHTVSEVPQHAHSIPDRNVTVDGVSDHSHTITGGGGAFNSGSQRGIASNNSANFTLAAGDSSHSHTITIPQHNTNNAGTSGAESQSTSSYPKYVELTICEKN